ncbi:hypothetical protein CBR_g18935 [Chara braunii]|uniref:Protein kinase domain-containing protein n=1 Tax=Chara braunii TaxID=69332 RepID=A0A388KWU6_CHABU|nr:hypothetical protein CBR_g18935 [Chara braunii]|eukprot:GBG74525.1 hypothetical protein CBR_g18935 [Chara braunii]
MGKRVKEKGVLTVEGFSGSPPTTAQVRQYTTDEIRRATRNFAVKIGGGGFGHVFKGMVKCPPNVHQWVAVKKLSNSSRQGITELVKEIQILPLLHHRHLVRLLGFCNDDTCQALVYEYIGNGTLRDHLHRAKAGYVLPWSARISIALDVANAISYLHLHVEPAVIHRDIKPSNILLDERMNAKLADFGLSKLLAEGEEFTHITTDIKGTAGYLDPQYFLTRQLTDGSDVYSFGVVLLEIISGRRPVDASQKKHFDLVKWAREEMSNDNIRNVLDSRIKEGEYSVESLWQMAECAITCCEPFAANRPKISVVVRTLQEAKEFQTKADSARRRGATAAAGAAAAGGGGGGGGEGIATGGGGGGGGIATGGGGGGGGIATGGGGGDSTVSTLTTDAATSNSVPPYGPGAPAHPRAVFDSPDTEVEACKFRFVGDQSVWIASSVRAVLKLCTLQGMDQSQQLSGRRPPSPTDSIRQGSFHANPFHHCIPGQEQKTIGEGADGGRMMAGMPYDLPPLPTFTHKYAPLCGRRDASMGEAWSAVTVDIAGTQAGGRGARVSEDETHVVSDDNPVQHPGERASSSTVGGDVGGGQAAGKGKVHNPNWGTGETMMLLKLLFEEDALQQQRGRRQKMKTRKEKYEWIVAQLVAQGFAKRSIVDCERRKAVARPWFTRKILWEAKPAASLMVMKRLAKVTVPDSEEKRGVTAESKKKAAAASLMVMKWLAEVTVPDNEEKRGVTAESKEKAAGPGEGEGRAVNRTPTPQLVPAWEVRSRMLRTHWWIRTRGLQTRLPAVSCRRWTGLTRQWSKSRSGVTDGDETAGGSDSAGQRRKAVSDSREQGKSRRTGGGQGKSREQDPHSPACASKGGSFMDVAHTLVDANERTSDKIADSFVQAMDGLNKTMVEGNATLLQCFTMLSGRLIEQAHELARKRGLLFERVSKMVEEMKRLRAEIDNENVKEVMAVSKAEAAERTIEVLWEEVLRLQQLLTTVEGQDKNSPKVRGCTLSGDHSLASRWYGGVASLVVSISAVPSQSAPRWHGHRRVVTPPSICRPSTIDGLSPNANCHQATAVAEQLRRAMAVEPDA